MFGRFGGILFPYINYLSKLNIQSVDNLPLIVFGVFSVVGGCLAIPLPETRHRPLPNTIDDVENYEEFCRKHGRIHDYNHGQRVDTDSARESDDDQKLFHDTKV